VERLSEILFGLIMALSFTGSLSIAESGRGEIRTMLIGAIGCNTAWGIVDAVMYLITTLVERRRGLTLLDSVRSEPDAERARRTIAENLPPVVAASIRAPELEHVRLQLTAMREVPGAGLTPRDFLGALGVFLLVFLSTLPVALPFLLPVEPLRALRISNGVAIVMLFAAGYRLGQYAGRRALAMGASMVAIGAALIGITLALGG
jgi:VIT1/CCC1 family predicted Fe2+/Mn2+ transporter